VTDFPQKRRRAIAGFAFVLLGWIPFLAVASAARYSGSSTLNPDSPWYVGFILFLLIYVPFALGYGFWMYISYRCPACDALITTTWERWDGMRYPNPFATRCSRCGLSLTDTNVASMARPVRRRYQRRS
jgi:hypothetical protein